MNPALMKWDIFLKSFLIQAAWNPERMQNVGFLFALRRSLKIVWAGRPDQFEAAIARASSFFNTHPYFAPAVMGVTVHLEKKVADGSIQAELVESVKSRISPPLNALGSLWFWDHLKLLSFLIAMPLLVLREPIPIAAGAALFFCLFNYHHLRTRWVGLSLGMACGEEMVGRLVRFFPSRVLPAIRRTSAFLLGLTTPLAMACLFERLQDRMPHIAGLDTAGRIPDQFYIRLGIGLALVAVSITVIHRRWLSVYQLLAVALALSIGIAQWL